MTDPKAVLSVDTELLRHTPAYRNASGTLNDDQLGRDGVEFLLETFRNTGLEATFYVVSELAEESPEMVAEISRDGHEIGSHTHTHRLLSDLPTDERSEEIQKSRQVLQETTGQPVDGFRAPAFDIEGPDFGTLESTGYTYDSSVISCRRIPGWYGGEYDLHEPCSASDIHGEATTLQEVPVSVMPGLGLPLSGAWIRIFGRQYTALGMWLLRRRGIAPVLYVHPWELVDIPNVTGLARRMYWRTGEWMRETIRYLLRRPFDFVPAKELVETQR